MHHPVVKLTSHINMTKGQKNVSPSTKRWVHDNHHRKVKELTNPTCQQARSDQLVHLNPSTKIQVGRTTLLQLEPPAQTVKVVTVGRVNSRWSGKMSKTWTQNLSLRLLPVDYKWQSRTTNHDNSDWEPKREGIPTQKARGKSTRTCMLIGAV